MHDVRHPVGQYEGLLDSFDQELEWARLKLAKQITTLMAEFPSEAFTGPQPPRYWLGALVPLRLFGLGEFRRIRLEPLTGQTTLFIGQNHRLYEYGPDFVSTDDADAYQENLFRIRGVRLGRLSYGDLLQCRGLLDRIWI